VKQNRATYDKCVDQRLDLIVQQRWFAGAWVGCLHLQSESVSRNQEKEQSHTDTMQHMKGEKAA
jgi:hypothetical protein